MTTRGVSGQEGKEPFEIKENTGKLTHPLKKVTSNYKDFQVESSSIGQTFEKNRFLSITQHKIIPVVQETLQKFPKLVALIQRVLNFLKIHFPDIVPNKSIGGWEILTSSVKNEIPLMPIKAKERIDRIEKELSKEKFSSIDAMNVLYDLNEFFQSYPLVTIPSLAEKLGQCLDKFDWSEDEFTTLGVQYKDIPKMNDAIVRRTTNSPLSGKSNESYKGLYPIRDIEDVSKKIEDLSKKYSASLKITQELPLEDRLEELEKVIQLQMSPEKKQPELEAELSFIKNLRSQFTSPYHHKVTSQERNEIEKNVKEVAAEHLGGNEKFNNKKDLETVLNDLTIEYVYKGYSPSIKFLIYDILKNYS